VLLAPDVFDQRDDDGLVVVLDENPPAELHAAVRESAVVCPAAAIRLAQS
jgi:ferredoxin